MAIGLDCPGYVNQLGLNNINIDNEVAKQLILKLGNEQISAGKFSLNPISGVRGTFYTDNRIEDLKQVCWDIIEERKS